MGLNAPSTFLTDLLLVRKRQVLVFRVVTHRLHAIVHNAGSFLRGDAAQLTQQLHLQYWGPLPILVPLKAVLLLGVLVYLCLTVLWYYAHVGRNLICELSLDAHPVIVLISRRRSSLVSSHPPWTFGVKDLDRVTLAEVEAAWFLEIRVEPLLST